jgi:hypothetical protein
MASNQLDNLEQLETPADVSDTNRQEKIIEVADKIESIMSVVQAQHNKADTIVKVLVAIKERVENLDVLRAASEIKENLEKEIALANSIISILTQLHQPQDIVVGSVAAELNIALSNAGQTEFDATAIEKEFTAHELMSIYSDFFTSSEGNEERQSESTKSILQRLTELGLNNGQALLFCHTLSSMAEREKAKQIHAFIGKKFQAKQEEKGRRQKLWDASWLGQGSVRSTFIKPLFALQTYANIFAATGIIKAADWGTKAAELGVSSSLSASSLLGVLYTAKEQYAASKYNKELQGFTTEAQEELTVPNFIPDVAEKKELLQALLSTAKEQNLSNEETSFSVADGIDLHIKALSSLATEGEEAGRSKKRLELIRLFNEKKLLETAQNDAHAKILRSLWNQFKEKKTDTKTLAIRLVKNIATSFAFSSFLGSGENGTSSTSSTNSLFTGLMDRLGVRAGIGAVTGVVSGLVEQDNIAVREARKTEHLLQKLIQQEQAGLGTVLDSPELKTLVKKLFDEDYKHGGVGALVKDVAKQALLGSARTALVGSAIQGVYQGVAPAAVSAAQDLYTADAHPEIGVTTSIPVQESVIKGSSEHENSNQQTASQEKQQQEVAYNTSHNVKVAEEEKSISFNSEYAATHNVFAPDTEMIDGHGGRLLATAEVQAGDGESRIMQRFNNAFGLFSEEQQNEFRQWKYAELQRLGISYETEVVGDEDEKRVIIKRPYSLHPGAQVQLYMDADGNPHIRVINDSNVTMFEKVHAYGVREDNVYTDLERHSATQIETKMAQADVLSQEIQLIESTATDAESHPSSEEVSEAEEQRNTRVEEYNALRREIQQLQQFNQSIKNIAPAFENNVITEEPFGGFVEEKQEVPASGPGSVDSAQVREHDTAYNTAYDTFHADLNDAQGVGRLSDEQVTYIDSDGRVGSLSDLLKQLDTKHGGAQPNYDGFSRDLTNALGLGQVRGLHDIFAKNYQLTQQNPFFASNHCVVYVENGQKHVVFDKNHTFTYIPPDGHVLGTLTRVSTDNVEQEKTYIGAPSFHKDYQRPAS